MNTLTLARVLAARVVAGIAILALSPLPANATSLDLTLTGAGGPFDGTFTPGTGDGALVTALSIVVDGTTYDDVSAFFGVSYFTPSDSLFPNALSGFVFPDGYVTGTNATVLDLTASSVGGVVFDTWNLASATAIGSGGTQVISGPTLGNVIVGATSSVPEPATLALLCLGIFGVGLSRRRFTR